jgi:soluble P-type ATPase
MHERPGITIPIEGFGTRTVRVLVADYNGTLACGGRLSPVVRQRLLALRELLGLHIITADTFGLADRELDGIVKPHRLEEGPHDVEKERYVKRFDPERVVAFGNGNNDRLMMRAIKNGGGLAVAVDNGEGCALDTLLGSNLLITGAANALDLLLESDRCRATLRL